MNEFHICSIMAVQNCMHVISAIVTLGLRCICNSGNRPSRTFNKLDACAMLALISVTIFVHCTARSTHHFGTVLDSSLYHHIIAQVLILFVQCTARSARLLWHTFSHNVTIAEMTCMQFCTAIIEQM
jgi:hypothetical protein